MEYRGNMRWTNQMLAAASALLMSSGLQAVPAAQLKENYQSIIERNPFGLKPPPPPVTNTVPEVKEKPKLEVFLTGIASMGYPKLPKQAYFYTVEQGKKEPTYYTMTEGDGRDGIQVLNIDQDRRKVRIRMDDKETLLSFDTHGVRVAAMPAKPGVPGAPGTLPMPGQPAFQPGVQPIPSPQPTSSAMYNANGQPVYNPSGQPVNTMNPNTGTGLRQIPSRRIRGGSGYSGGGGTPPPLTGAGTPPAQPEYVDPAEDYIRMHLNRAAKERDTGVPMPPLPTFE